jgi:hypothetical protein
MTVPGVAAGNHYPICAALEGAQDKVGADTAGAGNTDNTNIGRISHPAGPGQVTAGIAAPVAAKSNDEGFKGL